MLITDDAYHNPLPQGGLRFGKRLSFVGQTIPPGADPGPWSRDGMDTARPVSAATDLPPSAVLALPAGDATLHGRTHSVRGQFLVNLYPSSVVGKNGPATPAAWHDVFDSSKMPGAVGSTGPNPVAITEGLPLVDMTWLAKSPFDD
jgi:hypothetical protein